MKKVRLDFTKGWITDEAIMQDELVCETDVLGQILCATEPDVFDKLMVLMADDGDDVVGEEEVL
jgi:hypothetical protein